MLYYTVKQEMSPYWERTIAKFDRFEEADKYARKESRFSASRYSIYKNNRTGEHFEAMYIAGRVAIM